LSLNTSTKYNVSLIDVYRHIFPRRDEFSSEVSF
jgi:hypothetical protein